MSQSEDASHVSPELLTSLLIHTSRLPNCILRRGNLKSEPSFSKRFHISQSGGFPSVSVIRKWRKTLCRCECNVWCRNVDVNVLSICVTIPTLWRWIIFLNSRIENLLSVSKGSLKISSFIQCIFNYFLTYPENVSSLLDRDMNLRCWLGPQVQLHVQYAPVAQETFSETKPRVLYFLCTSSLPYRFKRKRITKFQRSQQVFCT